MLPPTSYWYKKIVAKLEQRKWIKRWCVFMYRNQIQSLEFTNFYFFNRNKTRETLFQFGVKKSHCTEAVSTAVECDPCSSSSITHSSGDFLVRKRIEVRKRKKCLFRNIEIVIWNMVSFNVHTESLYLSPSVLPVLLYWFTKLWSLHDLYDI